MTDDVFNLLAKMVGGGWLSWLTATERCRTNPSAIDVAEEAHWLYWNRERNRIRVSQKGLRERTAS